MEVQYAEGTIHLITGPMFSGKSTELIRRLRRYLAIGKKVMVVSHKDDNRYAHSDHIVTHDKLSIRSKSVSKLADIENELWKYGVIAIDEAQFFPDTAQFAEKWANEGKILLLAALDSNYQRRPFNSIQNLFPLAEEIIKLKAICHNCKKEAAFTFRKSDDVPIQVVGGAELYEARCRKCHQEGEAAKANGTLKAEKECGYLEVQQNDGTRTNGAFEWKRMGQMHDHLSSKVKSRRVLQKEEAQLAAERPAEQLRNPL